MASEVVTRILDLAAAEDDGNRQLLLLAAQCYGAAGRLEPSVAERTRSMLAAVLPPKTMDEAELVSYAGDEVLPWLQVQTSMAEETALCCMRSAALIGGDGAVATLATYASMADIGRGIVQELVYDWRFFDMRDYASDILADLPLDDVVILLDSAPMVRMAHMIDHLRRVRITAPDGLESFEKWARLEQIEEIEWKRSSSVESLEGLGRTGLRKLNLSEASQLADLTGIRGSRSLRHLYLDGCENVGNLNIVGALEGLEVLSIDGCRAVKDFDPISQLTALRHLSLNGCGASDLDFCLSLRNLETLQAATRMGIEDGSILANCSRLRRMALSLRSGSGNTLAFLPESLIWELKLSGDIGVDSMRTIGACTLLGRLAVKGVEWLRDASMLGGLTNLRRLSIIDSSQLRYVSDLGSLSNVEYLDLSGSDVADTEFARQMTQLRQVRLERCRSLASLAGLFDLPHLEYVSIVGGAVRADAEELRRRSASGPSLVVVEESYGAGSATGRILEASHSAPGPSA